MKVEKRTTTAADLPLQNAAHSLKSALCVMTVSKCLFKNLRLLLCLRDKRIFFFPDTEMFTDLLGTLLKLKEFLVYRGRSGTGMTTHNPPDKVLAIAMLLRRLGTVTSLYPAASALGI